MGALPVLGQDRFQLLGRAGPLILARGEKFEVVLERCGTSVDLENEFGAPGQRESELLHPDLFHEVPGDQPERELPVGSLQFESSLVGNQEDTAAAAPFVPPERSGPKEEVRVSGAPIGCDDYRVWACDPERLSHFLALLDGTASSKNIRTPKIARPMRRSQRASAPLERAPMSRRPVNSTAIAAIRTMRSTGALDLLGRSDTREPYAYPLWIIRPELGPVIGLRFL